MHESVCGTFRMCCDGPRTSAHEGCTDLRSRGPTSENDPKRSLTAFVATACDDKSTRVLMSMPYLSPIRILPMTSKSVPLGRRTKKSPIAIDGSRTMLEMLRSWVIITKFEEEWWSRTSCKTRS